MDKGQSLAYERENQLRKQVEQLQNYASILEKRVREKEDIISTLQGSGAVTLYCINCANSRYDGTDCICSHYGTVSVDKLICKNYIARQ